MANLNKVMLIGRLTRDPETRTFINGGKVTKFGFAVAYIRQKKNPATGEWEGGETAFIDVEVFNSNREGGRQLADLVEQRLRKGQQVYLEGRLRLNEWTDKDGQKRSKLLVVADNLEFLDSPGMSSTEGSRPPRSTQAPRRPTGDGPAENFHEPEPEPYDGGAGRGESGDIPF
jgi:single-strand DNA-binding protein